MTVPSGPDRSLSGSSQLGGHPALPSSPANSPVASCSDLYSHPLTVCQAPYTPLPSLTFKVKAHHDWFKGPINRPPLLHARSHPSLVPASASRHGSLGRALASSRRLITAEEVHASCVCAWAAQ
ncbi:hypothetical protein VTK26DRAFT_8881 [Humicola hyalothermophila]